MANDMTAAFTVEHGQVAVFVAVDHASAECVGIHAALHGTRHEALEPVRQGVADRFGGVERNAAEGLSIRHDHGSQDMARDFQREIAWLGAFGSPSNQWRPTLTLPGLHPGARGQRLRRAFHPDAEGEPALGQDLPDRR